MYVNDPDDWDLPDKRFEWHDNYGLTNLFTLNAATGMLTMSSQAAQSQTYELRFRVSISISRDVEVILEVLQERNCVTPLLQPRRPTATRFTFDRELLIFRCICNLSKDFRSDSVCSYN